jgi:hypothetical protein
VSILPLLELVGGYGMFIPNHIKNSMNNISIEDWGINEYDIKGSSIRKYLK